MKFLGLCNSCNSNLNNKNKSPIVNKCRICYLWNFKSTDYKDINNYTDLITFLSLLRKRANNIIRSYKRVDYNKNREFNLTVRWIEQELIKGCFYCSYPATGLDRINNSIGHIKSNCVACCHECNIIRMDKLTHQDIIFLGKSIKEMKDTKGLNIIDEFNKVKNLLENKSVKI